MTKSQQVNILLAQGRGYRRAALKKEEAGEYRQAKRLFLKASRAFLDASKLVRSVSKEEEHKNTANLMFKKAMIVNKKLEVIPSEAIPSEVFSEPTEDAGAEAGAETAGEDHAGDEAEPASEALPELEPLPEDEPSEPGPPSGGGAAKTEAGPATDKPSAPSLEKEAGATPPKPGGTAGAATTGTEGGDDSALRSVLASTRRPVRKMALVISKRWKEYEVGLRIPRDDEEPASVYEFIKVSPGSRREVIEAIERLATVANILWAGIDEGADRRFQHKLEGYGRVMYAMFLPTRLQEYLRAYSVPLLLETNDSEVFWELLHDDDEFLCMKHSIGRRLRSREMPKMNPFDRSRTMKLLFIANPRLDLPSTEKEIEYVMDRLESDASIDALVGKDANNVNVLGALRSGGYDIIHYAGHAVFSPDAPDESALLLAGEGRLYAQEVKRALQGRPVVFLNACSSSKEVMNEAGTSYTGSDTEGLSSAFILGGALGLIGTAWPVYDTSAAVFASTFYRHLLGGATLGEAMRDARRHLRETRPTDINWASFILYADPTLQLVTDR